MLPLQSIEGQPPHAAGENGETRQQKPKTLPCKYCSKRFRRVEHVQRHERTHTKEKPFACGWARCGKTFGRRDLLVRHEKLVHLNEGSKENNRPRKTSSSTHNPPSSSDSHVEHEMLGVQRPPPQPQYHQETITAVASTMAPDPRMSGPARAAACNLDLLSDAALASEVNPMQQPMMADMGRPPSEHARIKSYDEQMGYADRPREDPNVLAPGFAPQPPVAPYDDYHIFLDDLGTSSYLPPPFESDQQIGGLWPRGDLHQRGPSKPSSQFPSRFPSVQPDGREVMEGGPRSHEESMRAPLRISAADHTVIKNRLEEFSSVIPNDFVFPSRHTLTRFLEGYISGFHEYLPFLHIPTLTPAEMAPELLLAILAVGAQYRFESHRGHALWYAAKAVALEQIRRRHSHEVHALLPTPAAYSPHSTRPSPSSGFRHTFASAQQDRPMTQDTHREPFSPNTPQARLETIQAVLLLFAVGLWGAKAILHEALSLQSQLAMLVREEGLVAESSPAVAPDWETWIRLEGATRTKLIAYCFFNLCSIAYNMPPLILTSELNLFLPFPSRLWRAESAWQWQEVRQAYPSVEITVHDAFARLFGRSPQGLPPHMSSLGNYVLIHALLQHVYLLKQTSLALSSPFEPQRGLKPEDVEEVTQALRVWQSSFEHRHQLRAAESGHMGSSESFQGGQVAFNSTALLRLAYMRLYTEIPPGRCLETRDHMLVASSLSNMPLLFRTGRLHRAVFQAIHALSMLVKAGVNYVARTKSLEWSIQHSLCNFECAILLSKWLLTLASIGPNDPPATAEEKNLLQSVRRMLDETEFAVPIDPSLGGPTAGQPASTEISANDSTRLRQLAAAVIRLWAETFKGSHIFEMVRVMGSSLDGYADLVEKPRDRTPLGRIAHDPSLA
ncbi:C2H2 transcription factor [Colletotrichum kahawae]|uniref:C2H2 transcription factor n=1 Tax=Colletotrichum kahawae TaxID=34407 RepID=A0AAD9YFY4_COLKA|nr:C2H2 transcription factor [Colletotrichum kahawae]